MWWPVFSFSLLCLWDDKDGCCTQLAVTGHCARQCRQCSRPASGKQSLSHTIQPPLSTAFMPVGQYGFLGRALQAQEAKSRNWCRRGWGGQASCTGEGNRQQERQAHPTGQERQPRSDAGGPCFVKDSLYSDAFLRHSSQAKALENLPGQERGERLV